jgi:polyisoprenyl-phosphate glycosyltransferase
MRVLTSDPNIGLVVPCYNEEAVLDRLFKRLDQLRNTSGFGINIVFVNDGSTDRTKEMLQRICEEHRDVSCIHFSRNFGHQAAVSAGLNYVKGDAAVVLDADLQDPPEVIPSMVDKWREGYDVVYGVRRKRKEGALLKAAYFLFYRMMKKMVSYNVPLDAGDFALVDRRVIDAINQLPEKTRFVRGLRGWVGYKQIGLPYERASRQAGDSKYSFVKLCKLAMDGIIAYSTVPLRIGIWIGIVSAVTGLLYFPFVVYSKYVMAWSPPGWASLAGIILFLGGAQLLVLGVIGEYIGRIFDEVKARPTYIIDTLDGKLDNTK